MLTIVGCGNPIRSDDGVGIEVARRLAAAVGDEHKGRVRILDAGTDGMGVMFKARGATSLVLIDACTSGAEAGAVFEVPGSELEVAPPSGLNLHDFRWSHALYAGRQILRDGFPSDVSAFLIEAQSLDHGIGLSAPVEAAARIVVERLQQRIAAAEPPASPTLLLKRGMLHIGHPVYARYLEGLNTVVLLRRGDDLLVLPVRRAAAGGYLLKVRNAAGDRVVDAADFFRDNGCDEQAERALTFAWSDADAALLVSGLFAVAPDVGPAN